MDDEPIPMVGSPVDLAQCKFVEIKITDDRVWVNTEHGMMFRARSDRRAGPTRRLIAPPPPSTMADTTTGEGCRGEPRARRATQERRRGVEQVAAR